MDFYIIQEYIKIGPGSGNEYSFNVFINYCDYHDNQMMIIDMTV